MSRAATHDRGMLARGIVVPTVAITMTVLLAFTVLAVDVGYILIVRTELQAAADAGALAGASALLDVENMNGGISTEAAHQARARASALTARNLAAGKPVLLEPSDVTIGHVVDPDNLAERLTPGLLPYNAVRVWARRDPNSPNGALPLFFARIWGVESTSVSASATAYLDNRVSGYHAPGQPGNEAVLPISVHVSRWTKWTEDLVGGGGPDLYGFDPLANAITLGPDGMPEMTIYPDKQDEEEFRCDGSGNFGLLHFGDGSLGATVPAEQIRNGLTEADLVFTVGSPEIMFYTEDGAQISHQIGGDPGISAGPIADALLTRLGDVVGFFVHESVSQGGANAEFTVVSIQYARLMAVRLTGGDKGVYIQPVAYYGGSEILTDSVAPEHGTAAKLRLIR